jgi:hypothetical protein
MRVVACLTSVTQACVIRNKVFINHHYQLLAISSWFSLPRSQSRWSSDKPNPCLILNPVLTAVYYFGKINDLVVTESQNTLNFSSSEICPSVSSFSFFGCRFRDVNELDSTESLVQTY